MTTTTFPFGTGASTPPFTTTTSSPTGTYFTTTTSLTGSPFPTTTTSPTGSLFPTTTTTFNNTCTSFIQPNFTQIANLTAEDLGLSNSSLPFRAISSLLDFNGPTPRIGLDAFSLIHQLISSGVNQSDFEDNIDVIDSYADSKFGTLLRMGRLAFVPDTPEVRQFVDWANRSYFLFNDSFDGIYATDENFTERVRELDGTEERKNGDEFDKTFALIHFYELDVGSGRVNYTIRQRYSVLPSTFETIYQFSNYLHSGYRDYITSGFLTLMGVIGDYMLLHDPIHTNNIEANLTSRVTELNLTFPNGAIVQIDLPNTFELDFTGIEQALDSPSAFTMTPMPTRDSEINPFYAGIGPLVGLVVTLCFLYPVSQMVRGIVAEKESKAKELLRTMGMDEWVFNATWAVLYFFIFLLGSLLITIEICNSFIVLSSPTLVFFFFLFFTCSMIAFCIMISTFFSKAKLAGIVGPILLFATVMPRYIFFSSAENDNTGLKLFFSILFSPTAAAFGSDILLRYEGGEKGIYWSTMNEPVEKENTFGAYFWIMFIDMIIYGVLGWYFEKVLPNEYGTPKHPLFFLPERFKWWKDENSSNENISLLSQNVDRMSASGHLGNPFKSPNFEPVISSEDKNIRVQCQGIRKVYDKTGGGTAKKVVAVKGMYLNMYQNQITALLGHNGAGKTTLINMLIGLYPASDGDCIIDGHSVLTHMKEIRHSMGICPQHNVIWDRLSCREHLELYAVLKGIPGYRIHDEVQSQLHEIGLSDKADTQVRGLSGGMKRKLCVGMALLGGSKIVFLDEPTSGMDPYSRRFTWNLLKKSRKGRTIVLTTHFMDEADLLGDRIAIMHSGELRCVGSSLFLKSRFGIGYSMNVSMVQDDIKAAKVIVEAVKRKVPTGNVVSVAGKELTFRFDLGTVKQFPDLFEEFETKKIDYRINSFGISVTTLEEVFIRIATSINELKKSSKVPMKDYVNEEKDENFDMRRVSVSESNTENNNQVELVELSPSDIPVKVEEEPSSPSPDQSNQATDPKDQKDQNKSGEVVYENDPNTMVNTDINQSEATGSTKLDLEWNKAERYRSFYRQLKTMLYKRYICTTRDKKRFFFEVLLPVVVVALILLIFLVNVSPAGPPIDIGPHIWKTPQEVFYTDNLHTSLQYSHVIDHMQSFEVLPYKDIKHGSDRLDLTPTQFHNSTRLSLEMQRTYLQHHDIERLGAFVFNFTPSVTRINLTQIGLIEQALGGADSPILSALSNLIGIGNLTLPDVFNFSSLLPPVPVFPTPSGTGTFPPNATFPPFPVPNFTLPFNISGIFFNGSFINTSGITFQDVTNFFFNNSAFNISNITISDLFQNVTVADLLQDALSQGTFGELTITNFNPQVELLHNSSLSSHSIPGYYAYFLESMHSNPNSLHRVSNSPLPLTTHTEDAVRTFLAVFIALFLLVPFCYLPASFIIFVVKERQSNSKHLQLVSSLHPIAYWLSTYMWDILNFFFVCICALIVFVMYPDTAFVANSQATTATFLVIFTYGLAAIPLSYCYSFMFEGHSTAQVAIAGIHFVEGFVLVIASFIMDSLEKTWETNAKLKKFYRLSPPFCLGESFINIAILPFFDLVDDEDAESLFGFEKPKALDWDQTGRNIVYLCCEAVCFFLLTLAIEYDLFSSATGFINAYVCAPIFGTFSVDQYKFDSTERSAETEDSDVFAERQRVEKGETTEQDSVIVKNLRKVYPPRGSSNTPHVAVQNLSVGFRKGDCFGFLGKNGAGKTTTMAMITGKASVCGSDVETQQVQIRTHLGYCPQFDPLLDKMTGREHLEMFARLRGTPEKDIPRIVNSLLIHLSLMPYADQISQDYSGGNKRKLALGIALIGDPDVVLLDEPSTGMDPVARRFMWTVIQRIRKDRCLILTTHSMEEVEATCSVVGIMVAGQFKCMGSLQHLKDKFGRGYHLEVQVGRDGSAVALWQFIKKHFPGCVLEEFYSGRFKIKIPLECSGEKTRLSKIFKLIESNKKTLHIVDYSVSQSSMEQIFISIVKEEEKHNKNQSEHAVDELPDELNEEALEKLVSVYDKQVLAEKKQSDRLITNSGFLKPVRQLPEWI